MCSIWFKKPESINNISTCASLPLCMTDMSVQSERAFQTLQCGVTEAAATGSQH